MNRKELYTKINELGLSGKVKACYGKNYTNCSDEQLLDIISSYKVIKPEEIKGHKTPNDMVSRLVEVLRKKRILLQSEVQYITDVKN